MMDNFFYNGSTFSLPHSRVRTYCKLQRKSDIIIYGINLGVRQLRGHRLLTHQQ
jgi:hypothetical protein